MADPTTVVKSQALGSGIRPLGLSSAPPRLRGLCNEEWERLFGEAPISTPGYPFRDAPSTSTSAPRRNRGEQVGQASSLIRLRRLLIL